jgi:hypothetical protein
MDFVVARPNAALVIDHEAAVDPTAIATFFVERQGTNMHPQPMPSSRLANGV